MNRRLVLFESAEGTGYTGNPRYVHEELQRRATGLRAVWSHADVPERFPEDVDLVRRDTFRYAWTLARAGHWVDSHNLPYCYRKRGSTRYLQTWHGQVLKKMGLDEPRHRAQPSLAKKYAEAVARWDTLLTPGPDFRRDFAEASGFGASCSTPDTRVPTCWYGTWSRRSASGRGRSGSSSRSPWESA